MTIRFYKSVKPPANYEALSFIGIEVHFLLFANH
jgi:hypothetical protein